MYTPNTAKTGQHQRSTRPTSTSHPRTTSNTMRFEYNLPAAHSIKAETTKLFGKVKAWLRGRKATREAISDSSDDVASAESSPSTVQEELPPRPIPSPIRRSSSNDELPPPPRQIYNRRSPAYIKFCEDRERRQRESLEREAVFGTVAEYSSMEDIRHFEEGLFEDGLLRESQRRLTLPTLVVTQPEELEVSSQHLLGVDQARVTPSGGQELREDMAAAREQQQAAQHGHDPGDVEQLWLAADRVQELEAVMAVEGEEIDEHDLRDVEQAQT
ncbi:hypothetical protein LTR56_010012 [Elasticomyces elasticus]|nr:hypothetical protein LTR56_010012 [Elasticomyces elasticus]KAK3665051.1 hypothetical protein LTR22_004106 [Elasticomyces elasticus]KAK4931574.1 hypothetical protein LTR49_001963 [Elasticomyces elasticus]KAK5766734.1 hypothetical protein LTS12_003084 [Elasticomyces elasticus]